MHHAEIVVVGAGPAGLGAALVLAGHGADVLVVDEQARPGGQIYRQPPEGFTVPSAGVGYAAGKELLTRAATAKGIHWRTGTVAWGIFGARTPLDPYGFEPGDGESASGLVVALAGPSGIQRVEASRILLAPGAYDLPVAFPGWTLPGVMAAGGVQAFVKAQGLVPGRRFVLAGAHPLLLVIAEQLLAAGADLAAVAFAQPRPAVVEGLRDLAALRGNWMRLRDAVGPLLRLRRADVPVHTGTVVTAAEGERNLERVRLARVDRHWRPVARGSLEFSCDTLALGYGFVPASELSRQAGCEHRWRPEAGGWIARHDAWLRSTQPSISVAGELTGVAGAEQALEEGRLAALGILQDLGRLSPARAEAAAAPVRRRLATLRRFSTVVQRRFAPRHEALALLATDATVICRCEEITAGGVRAALRDNFHIGTADALKLLTRVGMGPCQGRMCMLGVSHLIAAETGRDLARIGTYRARPPAKPIPLAALADAASERLGMRENGEEPAPGMG